MVLRAGLCIDRCDRNMAVIGQFCRVGCFEDVRQERMSPGEGQDEVDLVVGDELVDRIHEIEEADEIEIGLPGGEAGFEFDSFRFVFIGDLNVMFMIDVDDMQAGFEQFEDGFDGIDGNRVLYILEIRQQHDIFGGSGLSMGWNDDHRGDASSDEIEGIAAHEDLA